MAAWITSSACRCGWQVRMICCQASVSFRDSFLGSQKLLQRGSTYRSPFLEVSCLRVKCSLPSMGAGKRNLHFRRNVVHHVAVLCRTSRKFPTKSHARGLTPHELCCHRGRVNPSIGGSHALQNGLCFIADATFSPTSKLKMLNRKFSPRFYKMVD